MDPTSLANGIQLAIAPVFLLTAISGLIAALAGRIARVIDRARVLEERLDAMEERLRHADEPSSHERDLLCQRIDHMELHLRALGTRSRLINGAIALLVLCSILIGVTILELFLGDIGTGRVAMLSTWVPISFVSGLACFIAALVCFLYEVWLSTRMAGIGRWSARQPARLVPPGIRPPN